MKKKSCPLEKEIIESLKAEKLKPNIEEHLSECVYCREVAAIHNWMNEYKISSWDKRIQNKILPDLASIWKKAYVRGRPDKKLVKKALKPLIYPQIFSYGVFVVGIIFIIISNLDKIRIIFNSTLFTPTLSIFMMLMGIVLISTLFCGFAVAFEKRK